MDEIVLQMANATPEQRLTLAAAARAKLERARELQRLPKQYQRLLASLPG